MATRDTVYTLVVRLSGTTTGFNASFALVRAVRGMLEKDGVSATFTGQVGQNGIYEFSGMMGARLGLGVTSVSTTPAGGGAVIRLLKPDGTLLVDCSNFYVPGNCDVPVLPMTGTYSLTVNPSGTVTATVGLLLSTSLGDVLTVDGPAHTFSTARVGQDGFYTFSANANSNLTLLITGNNFGSNTLVRILRPDGTQLTSQTTGSATGYTVDFTPPTTGTYGITVDPYQASIGQMTLQLVEEASGSAGTVDGVETTVVLNAGQNGRYTFSGTMGARLGLGVTSVSTTPAGGSAVIKLLKPDGTLLVDCSNFYVPGNCDVPVLPMTGTYSLTVNPSGTVTATVGLLLSTSLGDVLTVDGPAHTFSTARVGQDGFYTFSANANSNLTLLITGNSFGSNTLVRILRPDGAQLTSQTTGSATGYTVDFTPPTTGTYGITVDPYQASIGQMTLQLVEEASGSAGTVDGVEKTVVLNAGQNGRYTFSGTMGARLGLGVTSVSTTPAGGSAVIKLLKPDGTLLVDCSNFYVPGNCDVPVLPMTGTYSLTVNPSGTVTATVGLLLSTSLGDVLTVDGPAHTFSTARVGQDGFYTFSANANSNLTLLITGNSFGSNTLVRILRPDGAQLTSQTTGSATGYTVNFTPPTTGTYGITVDPYQASIGQLSLGIKTAGAPSAPAQADVRK
ncbi:hypothetical protein [Myxococcus xanthus]|nr:hypothetical protein [Myxococcus xanthus]UYI18553.1 hypothetical protein N3T43_29245 [Myxococcus xanthus]UYI25984.1 hypothetical protein N1129_29695 [Myxococcus xanthus]